MEVIEGTVRHLYALIHAEKGRGEGGALMVESYTVELFILSELNHRAFPNYY